MNEATLPKGWAIATIDDLICSQGIFRDGDWVESKDQDQNGQVRLIQLADVGDGEFRDKSSRFLTSDKARELNCTYLQAGDILVARMPDPLGRACIFPLQGNNKFVTVVDVCVIRFGNSCVDSRYFLYALNSPMSRRKISDHQTGSTRKRISRGNLSTVQFPIAPLNEQHRIVAKIEELFSELDKGIENLKTAQAQLKVYRQALLKHAFEGKLTAQWREQRAVTPAKAGVHADEKLDSRLRGNDEPLETAAVLQQRIQQERAQRYQQQLANWEANGKQGSKPKAPKPLPPLSAEELAELPELPEGWGWVRLGDLVETNVGFAFKSSEFSASGIRLLRGENIEPRQLRWTDTRYWPNDRIDEFQGLLVNAGEIIIAMDRPVIASGLKVARVKQNDTPCLLVQRVARVKEQQGICTSYIFSAIDQNRFINHCLGNQTGTQLPHISEAQIRAYPVPLCPSAEQALVSQELDSRMSEVDQLDQTLTTSLQQAEALRQSILKRAFSGQLVPQDPHDEPASKLLARIRAERTTAEESSLVRKRSNRG